MALLFLICVVGIVIDLPFLFLSYEHERLREKYGKERGERIGEMLGLITGYLYFGFWAGLWIAPQERFRLRLSQYDIAFQAVFTTISIPLDHLILALVFLVPGAILGVMGVKTVSLRVAELHRPEEVVTTGVYSYIRHPQYLGGLLSHMGMTFLLSGLYSLLVTPFVIVVNYLIARKEEIELLREFGDEYAEYKKRVPMFIPRLSLKTELPAHEDDTRDSVPADTQNE